MPSTPVVVLDSTLTDIADAIRSKTGGTATMTPGQMPAQIASIPSGGGVGIPREVNANGVYGMPTESFTFSLPANATDLSERALSYAFYGCTSLTSVDLSSLTAVSGSQALNYAFRNCTGITSADLGSITEISGESALYYAFYGCANLASVNFGSLTTISGRDALGSAFRGCLPITQADFPLLTTISGNNAFDSVFRGCTSLVSVNLNALSTISGGNIMSYAFAECTNLVSVNFASLSTISGGSAFTDAFRGCTSLTSISFPALTPNSFVGTVVNQLNRLVSGVTGCTLHFPAATQAKIETMDGYPNFGGTNTTVLFDL